MALLIDSKDYGLVFWAVVLTNQSGAGSSEPMEVRLKARAGSGYSLSAVGYLVMALGARAEESSDNYTGVAASVGC